MFFDIFSNYYLIKTYYEKEIIFDIIIGINNFYFCQLPKQNMKITIIGTGYVGLVSGTCFAETGHDVLCIDVDEKKINNLKKGIVPIYEPGLEEMVKRNSTEGRLSFSTDIQKGVEHGLIVMSAVGTPPDKDHSADLQYVKAVAKSFGEHINEYKVFVNKSTVPVGTGEKCKAIIEREIQKREIQVAFDIVSNPEFLREGAAIMDTLKPERIIVGAESNTPRKIMEQVYSPILRASMPLVFTNIETAEVIKYASNSYLATKISFINEIANFCEKVGANVQDVARGMGFDSRISPRFLQAGIGYGGSCFPKDVQALVHTGEEHGTPFQILTATEKVNYHQKGRALEKLKKMIPDLKGKTIAIWGLSFKPKTDDMRDAPSIRIIEELHKESVKIRAFDPIAMKNAKEYFLKEIPVFYAKNPYDAAKGADAVILVTEWDAFRGVDLNRLKKEMNGDVVIDGRNIYSCEEMHNIGLQYDSIGKMCTRDMEEEK